MKKSIAGIGLVASVILLAGCNSGVTYGTGVSHEEQTIKGLSKMFSMNADKDAKKINYAARPDLVLPASNATLPAPADQQGITDPDWPVTPEQKVAAVRGEVPEVDEYGNLPTEYLTDTNKPGIRKSSKRYTTLTGSARTGGGEQFIKDIRDEANGEGAGKLARERRDQLTYSTGIKRKFLTEPPTSYRTPSQNAEAGDLGISKETITARQKKIAKEKEAADRGVLTPGS